MKYLNNMQKNRVLKKSNNTELKDRKMKIRKEIK